MLNFKPLYFCSLYFRLYLAALHFNENSQRKQATTKTGNAMYAVSYPKARKGEGVAKEVKSKTNVWYV